ncbi:hypothetical protein CHINAEXTREME_17200 [Halobiforma lacisalsi AJ5]|uniref:Uncharacterized protein n=2 Tax=Natronobacterium lacisalsi TaxID=229731 RepID=M0LS89_NATLA|nr:hypothetical protein [Halobiforma lacisalsi]APW99400.1 hypothetical protein CHINAEXTREME_17200 [Halobiforma lacisalsi AJ5]EMA35299.1 hypothetical protein C445_05583 [Halobiforma lacisalsi AJ5]
MKRIERSEKPGNKYRTFCWGCESWGPMTSGQHFRESLHPHVLPADGDPDDPEDVIPLEEYDYEDEWEDLVDDVVDRRTDRARADGSPDDNPPDDNSKSTDENPVSGGHEFECPNCETDVTGYPDNCPHCSVPYNWGDNREDAASAHTHE